MKKRKLLFIFTGGTIGSTLSEDYICVDEKKPYQLIEQYRERYGIDFAYDTLNPYTILSENNNGSWMSQLANCLLENLDKGYDGIIVTHGTDTLPYAAALLSSITGAGQFKSALELPICLVSSAYPLEDERQNAIDNLYVAIKVVEAGYKGVFVPYRNQDGICYIHYGHKLLASSAFSPDFFSLKDQYFARMEEGRLKIRVEGEEERQKEENALLKAVAEKVQKKENALLKTTAEKLQKLQKQKREGISLPESCRQILWIHPYPGLSYPKLSEETRAILHETYHSGTLNTADPEGKAFFEEAYKRGIPVYLTGVSEGISYESTSLFEELHLIPLYDMAPIAAYVSLWLLLSLSADDS